MSTRTLDDRKERLAELKDDVIPRIRREIDALDDEIAEALADGREPNGLREEREQKRDRLQMIEGVIPVIEDNLTAAEAERLRDEAADLLGTLKKRAGGIAGEQDRRIERFADHLEKARAELRAAAEAAVAGEILGRVADVLAAEVGADRPDLRDVPWPTVYDAVDDAIGWTPADEIFTARRQRKGVSRSRREDPGDALATLAAIAVDVEAVAEARRLVDRLRELDDGDGEG